MKRVFIVLVSLAIPLQLGAGGQNRQPLLAYDYCGPFYTENGWEIQCEVRLLSGDPNPMSLMSGTQPAWSADGLRLAVANNDLAIYDVARGGTISMSGTSWVDGPRWSPDNARIAFASDRDGARELYVIDADGAALRRLTDNVGFRGGFAWSPGGTTIAFGATVGGVPELFVMQADGSNKTRLTSGVGFTDSAPSWSRDGARIAFNCVKDICSVNADGTNFMQLTTDPVAAGNAVFSPADGRIAFLTARFGAINLAILAEDGTVTSVAPGLSATQHAWSPGGDRLAFVNPRGPSDCSDTCTPWMWDMVYTVNSDGSALKEVGEGHFPRWATSLAGQPAAAFTYHCSGSACQFDATDSFDPDGSVTSYVWSFGDGTTGSGATAAHQYATGKQYNVKLTVTDNAGAIGISFHDVVANAPPVASFTVSCNGATCTFNSSSSDPDGTIAAYTWDFGDGSYGWSAPVIIHRYATGTFRATLAVSDNGGRSASAEATVTVVNAVPVAAFTATCSGLTCTLDASASSDDDVLYYRWDLGNGSSWTTWDKVAIRLLPAAGTYQITLTVTDIAGQTATSSRAVTAVPLPLPEVHVGNLTGSATSQKNTWSPYVTVQMHGANHQVVSGIQITATWSNGSTQSCATGTDGSCWFALDLLTNKTSVATLTITAAVSSMWLYKPVANHDADGSSNGTVITVRRR